MRAKKSPKKQSPRKQLPDTPVGAFTVGDAVVVRAIPFHYVGRIVKLGRHTVTLEDASWLADSGRWGSTFLLEGRPSEVEPYPGPVSVRYNTIADTTAWTHALPLAQK